MVLPIRTMPVDWRRRKYFPRQKSAILRNVIQTGVVTILSSHGYEPLKFWTIHPGNGSILRMRTPDVKGLVLEILAPIFCTTYIAAPEDIRMKMDCTMPLLVLVVEYLEAPFTIEFSVKDSRNMKRKFRLSTCLMSSKLSSLMCHMPLELRKGWNKVEIDLEGLTMLSYNTNYVEFLMIYIYANCRLRKVYFADQEYDESELPVDFNIKKPKIPHKPEENAAFTLYPANLHKE
ncbi:cilia- and flagella-associated protein 20 [Caerostris extrusa]|uniref:Cilia- and flagella-associated protein 20 n=1 Tax=Caerostris extrusa TaxID=172846 RepID=A0AAV4XXQ8_CAEEX|nr:cilia- and flagella-associated protein 20 [Caerostris extrusa]